MITANPPTIAARASWSVVIFPLPMKDLLISRIRSAL
jgi:hypothetical protein